MLLSQVEEIAGRTVGRMGFMWKLSKGIIRNKFLFKLKRNILNKMHLYTQTSNQLHISHNQNSCYFSVNSLGRYLFQCFNYRYSLLGGPLCMSAQALAYVMRSYPLKVYAPASCKKPASVHVRSDVLSAQLQSPVTTSRNPRGLKPL